VPSSSTSSIVGWTLSFILYFTFLSIGIYVLQTNAMKIAKYTASKKNLLNVTLVERQQEKVVKKKEEKVVKKVETVNIEKPKEVKKTVRGKKSVAKPVVKPALKNLFDKIDITKLPDETQRREKKIRKKIEKKIIDEVIKSKKANKITKALEFEQQENLIITQRDGVYDEFKGKVLDILDQKWQETIDTVPGNEAKVIIGIDKLGNFSYKIESLSYNDAFNGKLRDFLEAMKDVEFPPYTSGEMFNIQVVFKDILE